VYTERIMPFISADGTSLEIDYYPAEHPVCCLAVIPCMGGSFRMYRPPVERFTSSGISLLLYNPRGHGDSRGEYSMKGSVDDLDLFLSIHVGDDVPLFMMAHSGGSFTALSPGYARVPAGYLLVAPVLDSKESLFYMYDRGTIGEFNGLIALRATDPGALLDILSEPDWLDMDYWQRNGLENRLEGISRDSSIPLFLREIFLPGLDAMANVDRYREKTGILLCRDDHWYPGEKVLEMCGQKGIPVRYIDDARDHFFSGGWPATWDYTLEHLRGMGFCR